MISSLRIGPALVLPATRQVFVDGIEQRLGGRAFDLLLVLAQHRDSVVSKDELYDCVWPDVAVEPNNLPVQVWALRRVLGERAIATVPRRGYRLSLPVEVVHAQQPPHEGRSDSVAMAGCPGGTALRAFVERALARLEVTGWVTIVGGDAAARGTALRALREASVQVAPQPVWAWRAPRNADAAASAAWQRAFTVGGLIVVAEVDEPAARILSRARRAPDAGTTRILATSERAFATVEDTLIEAPRLRVGEDSASPLPATALRRRSRGREPLRAGRP